MIAVVLFGAPKKARFLDAPETIDLLAASDKSLIRYGDGEFFIMRGYDIHYQKADPKLAEEMRQLLAEYSDLSSDYYMAMPSKYFTCDSRFFLRNWDKMQWWTVPRRMFMQQYDRDVLYLDAFLFAKEYKGLYEKVWTAPSVSGLILVHNDEKYAQSLRESTGLPVDFIPIPPTDAYDQIDALVEQVKARHQPGKLVLISAGPCGKVMVYRLCKQGIRCIDTGHCFDDPLEVIE